ncbi:phosphatase PAP2 family protein [Aridibaculum aurantiacum]|uniref:phosphatase PAP2 family protein n=1 Tax=Aridibaculum aurantiacum TaxID=2810307 RepID=UPI001A975FA5|nr:phosphatase PAP2 family protein [Aridibaculum aurantiacum]
MANFIKLNYRNFIAAATVTVVVAVTVLYFSYTIGKNELFLLLNNDLGWWGDFFFDYATHAGDGLLWIVWLVVLFRTKRKYLFPLLISAFLFSTIFTQVGKQLVYPDELRPSEALKLEVLGTQLHDEVKSINGVEVDTNQDVFRQINKHKVGDDLVIAYTRAGKPDTIYKKLAWDTQLHLVDAVTVHTFSSFPSGHTATAFTFAFLICLITPSMALSLLCLLAAFIVGYTRIYLGQHYPLDVGAGMLVAVIATCCSIPIQQWFYKRKKRKAQADLQ